MTRPFTYSRDEVDDIKGERISTAEFPKFEGENGLAYINRLFAQVVRERRLELGLTQKQLAQKTRTQLQLIERLERGELNPQIFLVGKIMDALKIGIVARHKNEDDFF